VIVRGWGLTATPVVGILVLRLVVVIGLAGGLSCLVRFLSVWGICRVLQGAMVRRGRRIVRVGGLRGVMCLRLGRGRLSRRIGCVWVWIRRWGREWG
jgi:hypothetical protein